MLLDFDRFGLSPDFYSAGDVRLRYTSMPAAITPRVISKMILLQVSGQDATPEWAIVAGRFSVARLIYFATRGDGGFHASAFNRVVTRRYATHIGDT